MCDAELIAEIRNVLKTNKRRNSNSTAQSVAWSTKCPLCITENFRGHFDCKKRIRKWFKTLVRTHSSGNMANEEKEKTELNTA